LILRDPQAHETGKVVARQKLWKGASNEVQLGLAEPLLVTVPRGKYDRLKPMMDVPKTLVAPIAKGQKIGTVKVMLDGKVIAQRPLVAISAVEQAGFFAPVDELLMWSGWSPPARADAGRRCRPFRGCRDRCPGQRPGRASIQAGRRTSPCLDRNGSASASPHDARAVGGAARTRPIS
jgi:hypothetical protein